MKARHDTSRSPPYWAAFLHRVADRLIGGGRGRAGWAPLHVVIDLHKAATGPFVLVLMQAYDVSTPASWTYLTIHGTYGIAWVLKDVTFGDRKWRTRVGIGGVMATWGFLTLYWVAPALLVLGQAGDLDLAGWQAAEGGQLRAAIVLFAIGLVLMVGADVQKNAALARAPGLITTGFYARVRHPNYLGEILIYGSFALVVNHWIPWAILAAVAVLFFLPNMLAIEASLSRYPEYETWRSQTGFLLPR